MKTLLLSLLAFLSLHLAAFADCANFAGDYELIPGSSSSNYCDEDTGCFGYPTSEFSIVQNSCDDIKVLAPGTWSGELALQVSTDGKTLTGESKSLGRTMTTTFTQNADGSLSLDYTQVTGFLGNLAYPYDYQANYKKLSE